MLKIWGRRNSINVQKVMWAVGELELAHEHIAAGGSYGGLDTDEFGAMNPHRRVPVIDDDGIIVWESHAIIRYLALKHGNGSLWPQNAQTHAHADMWMEWVTADLQPAFIGLFWNYYRTPADKQDPQRVESGIARSNALFELLEHHMECRQFMAGDTLTMGDIPAGAQLYRYFTLDIKRPSLPNVERFYALLQTRQAFREHVMVPYEDLRGRSAF